MTNEQLYDWFQETFSEVPEEARLKGEIYGMITLTRATTLKPFIFGPGNTFEVRYPLLDANGQAKTTI